MQLTLFFLMEGDKHMADVVNLTKTEGERGVDLRFLGGVLSGAYCFVPFDTNEMEGASSSHKVSTTPTENGRVKHSVTFSMFGVAPTLNISKYRRMRIRLATPSAVLDEMVMVSNTLTDEQAKQELAKLSGLRLPTLHLFNVKRSTLISGVAWDKKTGTMDVLMKIGETYRYFNITDIKVMEFLAADSMGQHYNDVFRKLNSVNLNSVHSVIG